MEQTNNNNGNGRVTGLERDVAWIRESLQRIEHGQAEFMAQFEQHKREDSVKHTELDEFRASVRTWGRIGLFASSALQGVMFFLLERNR